MSNWTTKNRPSRKRGGFFYCAVGRHVVPVPQLLIDCGDREFYCRSMPYDYTEIQSATVLLSARLGDPPVCVLVLGSGFGGFTEMIESQAMLPYGEIPRFPASTTSGRAGRFVAAEIEGTRVPAMQATFDFFVNHLK